MTVPTPTTEAGDLDNSSNWTLQNGATTFQDDFGSIGVTGDGDNDRADFIGTNPIDNGTGSQHSFSYWFNTVASGETKILSSQRTTTSTGSCWDVVITSSGIINPAFFSATNGSSRIQSASSSSFNDGVDHHLGVTVNGNDLNIFIDGIEVSYSVQDSQGGSGFSGVPASGVANLTALDFRNGAFSLAGNFTRFKAWEGTTLTPSEMLEEFQNEDVLRGGNGVVDANFLLLLS